MERSVVWAICEVAARKSSTSTIERSASTTRKYVTAVTFTGTLSRVITSWTGIFSVTVRRLTRSMRSIAGTRITRPGPLKGDQSTDAEHHLALVLAQNSHRPAHQYYTQHRKSGD